MLRFIQLKYFLVFILFFFITVYVQAQERVLRGKVTDAQTGEPIEGVNVILKEKSSGVLTDINGEYRLKVPKNGPANILFIYPYKERKERSATGLSILSVQLGSKHSVFTNQEHVAFGNKVSTVINPLPTSNIESTDLSLKGSPYLSNLMKGKSAGLRILESSGLPGFSAQLSLRGFNSSVLGNQPLVVIDGLPITSESGFSGAINGIDYSSRINDLDHEDISSINLLKGASATALYGSRAANGAIVITTQTGSQLSPGVSQVSLSQTYMVDQPLVSPGLQNSFTQGNNGAFSTNTPFSWGVSMEDSSNYQAYDNSIIQQAYTSMTHFSWRGGGEKSSHEMALGYNTQDGLIPTSQMNRYNAKIGGDFKPGKNFKLGLSLKGIYHEIGQQASGLNTANPILSNYLTPSSYDLNGNNFATENDPYDQINYFDGIDNPLWSLENNSFSELIERGIADIDFEYKPASWLEFNYRAGADIFRESLNEVYSLGSTQTMGNTDPPSGGQINIAENNYRMINSNFQAKLKFGNRESFAFDLLLGNEIIDIQNESIIRVGAGINNMEIPSLANTQNQTDISTTFTNRTLGYFAQANIAIANVVFLQGGARQDNISNINFSTSDNIYPFGGINILFSELLADNNFLTVGRLKASYGSVGTPAILNTTFRNTFGFNNSAAPYFSANRSGLLFQNRFDSLQIDNNLTPQLTEMIDAGIELQLFSGRVMLSANYFTETTENMYNIIPNTTDANYTSSLINSGSVLNEGIEANLAIKIADGDIFKWEIGGNYTELSSEVLSVNENYNNISIANAGLGPSINLVEGESFPVIYGSGFLRDESGNLVVDNRAFVNGNANPSYGMPIQNPQNMALGKVTPDFWFGAYNSFRIAGLELFVQFDGQSGGNTYSGGTNLLRAYGASDMTTDRNESVILDAVKGYYNQNNNEITVNTEGGPNDIVIQKGEHFWRNVMQNIDESAVYSSDYIRLREARLGYHFDFSNTSFVKRLFVFGVGRNLWMISKFPDFDPELTYGSSTYGGVQFMGLSQRMSFGGGFKITF